MKKFKKLIASAIMLAVLATAIIPTGNAYAKSEASTTQAKIKHIDLKANSCINSSSTKLSWKKMKVDEIRIYYQTNGKKKLIKTLPGNKTSYKLKTTYNTAYHINVDGIKYGKNKKKSVIYRGNTYYYCGLDPVYFSEDYCCDYKSSPKYISFKFDHSTSGIIPDGYIIYRATSKSGPYKKLNTIKKSTLKKTHDYIKYTDKKVKFQKQYFYKIRSYKIIKGKKYYSEYSGYNCQRAVNYEGIFKVNKTVNGNLVTFELISDYGNAPVEFSSSQIFNYTKGCKLINFRFKDREWTKNDDTYNKLTINRGDKMYFTFELPDSPLDNDNSTFYIESADYDGACAFLYIDIKDGIASATKEPS